MPRKSIWKKLSQPQRHRPLLQFSSYYAKKENYAQRSNHTPRLTTCQISDNFRVTKTLRIDQDISYDRPQSDAPCGYCGIFNITAYYHGVTDMRHARAWYGHLAGFLVFTPEAYPHDGVLWYDGWTHNL
ncbi:MAG: hypothetical protein GXY44_00200 [Phycisphaerales bacterium]|nr:hypothetical protein [Phycisphaerales bacterium]